MLRVLAQGTQKRFFAALVDVPKSAKGTVGINTGVPVPYVQERKAVIYQRCKNAMQSGTGPTEYWLLEFAWNSPRWYNPLMGYHGCADAVGQLRMNFATKEAAVAFAQKQGYRYTVQETAPKKQFVKQFETKFKWRGPANKIEEI
eukprot:TRINITY_DN815_c0_g1_i3.p1 TRINITY_DN815_c0_g1~~TRINITY_DN815_c0_g1_i3.p1  ORF type:complete len:145 (+),score=62.20 TRINITY_DN815_c0_g1_i3:94-528(+)